MNEPLTTAPKAVENTVPTGGGSRYGLTLRTTIRAWLWAVQFLTRIPVPQARLNDVAQDPADLRQASQFFPLVGALLGLVTGGVIWCGLHLWPTWIAVVVGLSVEALLTGALHEDALADFFDAFGGGWTREDVLRILDDSRIGSFGALGLMLAVLLRGGALSALDPVTMIAAAMASAALGRWTMLWAMAMLLPVAGRQSLTQDIGRQVKGGQLLIGGLLAIPGIAPLTWLSPWRTAVAAIAVALLVICFVAYVRRRIGGITGDCLGCLCYLAQVLFLLCSAANWTTV